MPVQQLYPATDARMLNAYPVGSEVPFVHAGQAQTTAMLPGAFVKIGRRKFKLIATVQRHGDDETLILWRTDRFR